MPPAFSMPYLRYAKLLALRAQTRALQMLPARNPGNVPPCFIVGCGRSGTTILGKVFIRHPEVTYFREPYHLWRAVDARTDVTGLHGSAVNARFFLDADDRTEGAQRRFDRLIAGAARPATRVMEKLPQNVARIGWLESLSEGARYVHIIRSGISVAKSIERLATTNSYTMAFKSRYNQWWGTDDAKWTHLSAEGRDRGYYPDEIDQLTTHRQKGAYEWLASLGEAARWREPLGDRLLEVTYTRFTAEPAETLQRICAHVGVGCPSDWMQHAVDLVRPEQPPGDFPVDLPPAMARRFNEAQEQYQLDGRAGVLEGTGA